MSEKDLYQVEREQKEVLFLTNRTVELDFYLARRSSAMQRPMKTKSERERKKQTLEK